MSSGEKLLDLWIWRLRTISKLPIPKEVNELLAYYLRIIRLEFMFAIPHSIKDNWVYSKNDEKHRLGIFLCMNVIHRGLVQNERGQQKIVQLHVPI